MTMDELKPCPFCGEDHFELETGEAYDASAFWDSGIRGSVYGYVLCRNCNCMIKDDSQKKAVEAWNRRAEYEKSKS